MAGEWRNSYANTKRPPRDSVTNPTAVLKPWPRTIETVRLVSPATGEGKHVKFNFWLACMSGFNLLFQRGQPGFDAGEPGFDAVVIRRGRGRLRMIFNVGVGQSSGAGASRAGDFAEMAGLAGNGFGDFAFALAALAIGGFGGWSLENAFASANGAKSGFGIATLKAGAVATVALAIDQGRWGICFSS
jgi:hypothetical protein